VTPKPFLQSIGMQFDAKPAQLNNRFYKSLAEEQQEHVDDIWERKAMGLATNTELYAIPVTIKQAARLYSFDSARYKASLKWFSEVMAATKPSRVFEVGAGAGITSAYLKKLHYDLEVSGIEQHTNLAQIAKYTFGSSIQVGDYLVVEGDCSHDLVVCDFGFDIENLPPSTKPHSTAEVDGYKYCPGCAEDLGETMQPYFEKWKSWMNENGKLAVAGRFSNVGMVYAALVSAQAAGLRPIENLCKVLKTTQDGVTQKFPAMVFERGEMNATIKSAANLYSR